MKVTAFYGNFPYYIVLIASMLPWVAAIFDSFIVTLVPEFLLIFCYIYLATKFRRKLFNLGIFTWLLLLLVVTHEAVMFITDRGIASLGAYGLIFSTVIFYKILSLFDLSDYVLYKQVSIIYILHLIFICLELLIVLLGAGAGYIHSIVGSATEVMNYKAYNSATFLKYLGFDGVSGMNGLLLGSQSASQVMLFSAIWFSPLIKYHRCNHSFKLSGLFFVLSVFLFPFVSSMTAALLFVFLFSLYLLFIPNSVIRNPLYFFVIIFVVIVFSDILFSLITYRISSAESFDEYVLAFSDVPIAFLQLDLFDLMFGLGRNKLGMIVHTDFGLGMVVLRSGLIMSLVYASFLFYIFSTVISLVRENYRINEELGSWSAIASINLICLLGWAASLVHYTPAIALGGRHIFAFHIAITMLSVNKIVSIKKNISSSNSNHFVFIERRFG
jgi:hypothetical protein